MVDWIDGFFDKFAEKLMNVLPGDPFQSFFNSSNFSAMKKYLGYVAYFIPVRFLLSCLGAFLTALSAYYLVSILMRWLKAIS